MTKPNAPSIFGAAAGRVFGQVRHTAFDVRHQIAADAVTYHGSLNGSLFAIGRKGVCRHLPTPALESIGQIEERERRSGAISRDLSPLAFSTFVGMRGTKVAFLIAWAVTEMPAPRAIAVVGARRNFTGQERK